jgi:hypothetical protein
MLKVKKKCKVYHGIEELFEWWTIFWLELSIRTGDSRQAHAQATTCPIQEFVD